MKNIIDSKIRISSQNDKNRIYKMPQNRPTLRHFQFSIVYTQNLYTKPQCNIEKIQTPPILQMFLKFSIPKKISEKPISTDSTHISTNPRNHKRSLKKKPKP